MYKRLLAIGLAAMMLCLLVCGCAPEKSGGTDQDKQTNPTGNMTEDPSTQPTTEESTEDVTEEPTEGPTADDQGWVPAAPSGSLAPTEPDTDPTEAETKADEPEEEQPDTEPTLSQAEKDGCEENYTPWG